MYREVSGFFFYGSANGRLELSTAEEANVKNMEVFLHLQNPIRQNHCNCRADDGREQTSGGVEDGWNRHGAEYGIGNIIEEAAQKRRANLFPEDGEGQHADEIGDQERQETHWQMCR